MLVWIASNALWDDRVMRTPSAIHYTVTGPDLQAQDSDLMKKVTEHQLRAQKDGAVAHLYGLLRSVLVISGLLLPLTPSTAAVSNP